MKLKTILALLGILLFQACDFGSPAGGGGTGGEGLTGIIVNATGSPVVGAKVRVYPEEYMLAKGAQATAIHRDSTVTDSLGRFRFENLATGRYNLEASALIGDSVWSLFIPGIYLGETLDLGANILLATGSLEIGVREGNYDPLSGAHCYIVGGPWEAVSDLSGTCHFTGLAPGRYKVLVTYPGLQSVVKEDVMVISGEQIPTGSVILRPVDDGTDSTWTVRYDVPEQDVNALAWSGSLFVAVGSGTDVYGERYGLILTSPDGITWTKRSPGAKIFGDVIWAGNQFVAIGDRGFVSTSPDGITWTARPLPDTTGPLTAVVWSGTKLLVTGWNSSFTSSDGITWADSSQSDILWDAASSGSLFVGVAYDGVVKTSTDGLGWTNRNAQTTNTLRGVAWGGGQFVAVGDNGTIRTSVDGITWEKRVSGTTDYFWSVQWVNGKWIVNGRFQSTDGILWTPISYPYYPASTVSTGTRLVGIRDGIVTSP